MNILTVVGERVEVAPDGKKKVGYPTEAVDHDSVRATKEWLAKGLFAKGEHSRWIAPPKAMKSALLSSAANYLASGQPDWHGFKIKRKIGVLYCALERPGLSMRRLIAEQKLLGLSNLPLKLCRTRFSLATKADVDRLIATINETSEELEHRVEFVIIDTSAKLIGAHGGDEQQAKDNALVWGNLSDVRAATGVHTAVIGHLGKDTSKGERGSNSSLGDADFVVTITGDEVKTATVTDANDMAAGDLFSFRGREYSFGVDEDGDEDVVYIVDPGHLPTSKSSSGRKWPKGLRLVYDSVTSALLDSAIEHRVCGDGPVVRAVPVEAARAVHDQRYVSTGDGDRRQAEKKAWQRNFREARNNDLIGGETIAGQQLIWIVES